ncbi:hypothetical protein IFM89_007950 [Coptis chinensis]|uniref:O-fucosyltransferase family protein n=1 Tax=Coptis chinensis TaxID=261450 RepID=A0A835MAB6_9MAGN|nr:hypothetical protein IFM89_007950 [Coptis chinensis]
MKDKFKFVHCNNTHLERVRNWLGSVIIGRPFRMKMLNLVEAYGMPMMALITAAFGHQLESLELPHHQVWDHNTRDYCLEQISRAAIFVNNIIQKVCITFPSCCLGTSLYYLGTSWGYYLTDLSPDGERKRGKCPLTPEEVGLILRAFGFRKDSYLYVASGEIYGGQKTLHPLRDLFPNFYTREMLANE